MDIWIDVNKEIPENGEKVLVTDGKSVGVGYYDCSGFVGSDVVYVIGFFKPTHWAHLPKPYQPERSKREDPEMGCGALNIDESQ